ncbi:DUF4871 domain-containing protein [Bacillus carboniphilus]|uniref:DUF4871 domain-containing protein n=1 Tax=Bacillus carboniphilus TaxID=86663 RepID=A0ABY9JV02_9BACI|nr:DUF4871 domain-containing protein [Bacillus carboniphilus]WLR42272.1 DUF4871 domain-containing protein [Bacillus carboniphilus]
MIKISVRFFLLFITFVYLVGCSNEEWEESSIFESENYRMIGVEDKLGFIYDDSKATRFYSGEANKYMWHFWGDSEKLKGNLKVIATHNDSKEEMTVIENLPIGGPNNGADAHIPSMMSLPKKGMWKLDAYVDDQLHGSVFIKVYEQ